MGTNRNEIKNEPKACIIWMHGLGASSSDMASLAQEPSLAALAIKHVFLDAPIRPVTINAGMKMPAWYDITGTSITDREDREGISASRAIIMDAVAKQQKEGFEANAIFLAGFSQGGAMALYTALHSELPFAGVIALSAYLPLASELDPKLPKTTPIFMASGLYDHMVLPAWTKQAANLLSMYKYITVDEYPMEHTICLEEIQDLAAWLNRVLQGVYA